MGVAAGRRGGDADVEFDDAFFFGVVGHRIGAHGGFFHFGDVAPEVVFVPVGAVFIANVEVFVGHGVRRAFELHVAAGAEIDVFAFGQAQGEFLDEGGDVGVGLDRAFPLFHAEDFFGHANLHVLLDCRLA